MRDRGNDQELQERDNGGYCKHHRTERSYRKHEEVESGIAAKHLRFMNMSVILTLPSRFHFSNDCKFLLR